MTKPAFEKIKAGLKDAKAYLDSLPKERNDKTPVRKTSPPKK